MLLIVDHLLHHAEVVAQVQGTGRLDAGKNAHGRYLFDYSVHKKDALAKIHRMAKQKFRPTRLGGFSGTKAYVSMSRS
jgi:hypothetical protein